MRRAGYILALLVLLAVLGSPAAGAAFSDVDPESWYGEAVAELTGRGLLTGCPDGSFQPERPISAAEFVTIPVRRSGPRVRAERPLGGGGAAGRAGGRVVRLGRAPAHRGGL